LDYDLINTEEKLVWPEFKDLVLNAQTGASDAFVELFEAVQESLYRTACAILSNEQDACDALQETALAAYKNLKQLRHPEYFKTWITRILLNKCFVILKERKRMTPIGDLSTFESSIGTKGHSNSALLEAVESLSPPLKTVVVLRYQEGYSQKDIAKILQLPIGTVKSRLNAALKMLRKYLVDKGLWQPLMEAEP